MDKETKKGFIVILGVVLVIFVVLGLDAWMKHKNKFVYEEHLEDVVITVNDRQMTLREFGYYIYDVETKIDKQARIYNPEDPLDYWNTYFNSGLEGGYVSEMALDAALGSCVCDMIYEDMARWNGYELTEEEREEAAKQAEVLYAKMSKTQKQTTGLTQELVAGVLERKALVVKFASEYFEDVDFTEYSGYREELVSYAGDYYKEKILPDHRVEYNNEIVKELSMGRITTGHIPVY